MTGDGKMRASDADRDAVVAVLREAYAAGRLTLEEFGERTSAAYAGRTWGELRELTADLPERQPSFGAVSPDPASQESPGSQESPVTAASPPGAARQRGAPPQRPRAAGAVMPFVMFWFLIVLATRSPAAVAAPVVVLALLLLFGAMSRRR